MFESGTPTSDSETRKRYNAEHMIDRRRFILSSGVALLAPRLASAASARIEILPDETIGTIAPAIYGHFTEHLGGCIYDGVWVGENSKISNVGGIRKALVDSLKRIKAR